MNLSETMQTLHEGTWLGDVFPVESLKQVQEKLGEKLCVDSLLYDWGLDDELMDMCMASVE